MEINHLVSLGYPHDYGNLQITGDLTIAFGPRWPPGKPPLQGRQAEGHVAERRPDLGDFAHGKNGTILQESAIVHGKIHGVSPHLQ